VVGRVPADSAHFGIGPGSTEAELFDASGELRLHALCGRVAPGQRSSECFATATSRDTILHLRANPRSYIQWSPESGLPPLLDTRVIPLALGRGLPAKVSFGGAEAPAVREMVRREIPMERRVRMGPYGPTFEWFGTTAEGETRINDQVSFAYLGSLAELVFDELLGPRTDSEPAREKPSLTIAIEYDDTQTDTLSLGPQADGSGLYFLHHSTTNHLFLVSPEKASGLVPDAKALLDVPPPAGETSGEDRPDLPPLPELLRPQEK
jgi:hypothetical protein